MIGAFNVSDPLPARRSPPSPGVLPTREAAEYVGLSYAEWRAMHARGETPPAICVGVRKQGWKLGDLIQWIERKC